MPGSPQTIRDLRRRWKPHKERLATVRSEHPTAIRFHRACSWLSEVEQLDPVRHAESPASETVNIWSSSFRIATLC